MRVSLDQRLKKNFAEFTPAEKAIASYFLADAARIPFTTTAKIAEAVGVSRMTVGRFLRRLGYSGLTDLKEDLGAALPTPPLLISDRMTRLAGARGGRRLRTSYEAEVAALLNVYEMVGGDTWNRVAHRLANAATVAVAGFQTVEGLASSFVQRLGYLRPGARLLDGKDGTFFELLEDGRDDGFLFLVEMRRCTRAARLLAEAAASSGVPVAILCDRHCHWARDVTEDVLSVSTDSELFWDSQAPLVSAMGLLLDDCARTIGGPIAKRAKRLVALQDRFGAFE